MANKEHLNIIKQGVEAWNKWREDNPNVQPDFSDADIRGVNFNEAKLEGANFSNAKAGFCLRDETALCSIMFPIGFMLGHISMAIGRAFFELIKSFFKGIPESPLKNNMVVFFITAFSLLFLISMLICIIKKKFWVGVAFEIFMVIICVMLANLIALPGGRGNFMILGVLGICFLSIAWAGVFSCYGFFRGVLIVVSTFSLFLIRGLIINGYEVGICMMTLLGFIFYMTFVKEDEQFASLRKSILALIVFFHLGTNFNGADLTNADFGKAFLRGSQFNKDTIMKRACWQYTGGLNLSYTGGTILENRKVRELLVTGEVPKDDKSFAGLNLKGAYLVKVDLSNIDFTEADLSHATLEDANLTEANLTRVQALDVEFKGAILTGACLEAWNIDSTTQLVGTKAKYVYLLQNKKDRCPHKGNFGEGDFSKLFQKISNTLKFILKNAIEGTAFSNSFKKVREEIRVESGGRFDITPRGFEDKGDGFLVVEIGVPKEIDKAKVNCRIKQEVGHEIKLLKQKYETERETYKIEIAELKREAKIYKQEYTDWKKTIKKMLMEGNMNKEKNGSIHIGRDLNIGSGSNVNLGDISWSVKNTINQLPASSNPDQPGLKELLSTLQALIEKADEKELRLEEKMCALNEIEALATLGRQSKLDEEQESLIRKSLTFLKDLIAKLPKKNLAKKLWDLISAISAFFGI